MNNGETQLLDDYPMRFNDLNTGSRVGVFTKIAEYDEELLQTILRTSKQLKMMVFRVTNVSTAPRISVTLLDVHPITGKKSSVEYPPDADFQVSIAKDSGLQGPHEVTFDIEFDPSVLAQIDKAIADNRARAALEETFGAARIAKLTAFFSENRASGFQGLKRVSAYSLQLQVQ